MSKGEKAAGVLQVSGLGPLLLRIGAWQGVLVLNYHRIGRRPDAASDPGIWSASAEELDAQMRFLARHFELLSARDLGEAHARRNGRFATVTFDDGYRETYDIAYPILAAHGVPATFFLTTGFIDGTHTPWWDELAWMVQNSPRTEMSGGEWFMGPLSLEEADRQDSTTLLINRYKALSSENASRLLDYVAHGTGSGRRDPAAARSEFLTWDMARTLARGGIGIGGHTVSHPILARLPRAGQHTEISACLDRLKQELDVRPRIFSYPDGMPGSFDATTEDCLRENDVALAFSNYGGVASGSTWNPRDVPRTCIASVSQRRFRAIITLPSVFASKERRRVVARL